MTTSPYFHALLLAAVLILGGAALATPAFAQGSAAEEACTPDVMRLCNEYIPDRQRITACLVQRRAYLSPACRVVMTPKAKVKRKVKRRRR